MKNKSNTDLTLNYEKQTNMQTKNKQTNKQNKK